MAAELFLLPFRPALDLNALPIPGAALFFYATGTSTPQEVFADDALTVSLGYIVEANGAGVWPSIYLDNTKIYRAVLRDAEGAVLNEVDPYIPGVVDALAGDIAQSAAEATAAAAVLSSINGGYWEDSATPPDDAAEGQDYYAAFDGRAMLLRNVGGQGVPRWELATQSGVDANYKFRAGYENFNIFDASESNRRARLLHKPVNPATHAGTLVAGHGIEHRVTGSGANGPASADVGMAISTIKTTNNVGEIDGMYVVVRQAGEASDACAILTDVAGWNGGTGFWGQHEGSTKHIDLDGTILKDVRTQMGIIDTVNDSSFAYFATPDVGTIDHGLLLINKPGGEFAAQITVIKNSRSAFIVGGEGEIYNNTGNIGTGQYAKTNSLTLETSTGGSAVALHQEFRRHTAGTDWRSVEGLLRMAVDNDPAPGSSPFMAFRGEANATSSIVFGFGDGPGSFERVRFGTDGTVQLYYLPEQDFANDAAAASGGVPIGGLYHSGGTMKVRLT